MLPLYQYQVINDQEIEEFFEVEQKINEAPLTNHPLTKEPVKRTLTAASLSLHHSTQSEKKSISSENLKKTDLPSTKRILRVEITTELWVIKALKRFLRMKLKIPVNKLFDYSERKKTKLATGKTSIRS